MYENILVLLDCSPVDDAIISHIKKLARHHNSRVHLFHVIHAHTLDQERMMTARLEQCFSRASRLLEEEGISVDYSSTEGEPAEEVLMKASQPTWDLVAMATHGHKAISDFILGSVSDVLKHKLNKPLLMIRG